MTKLKVGDKIRLLGEPNANHRSRLKMGAEGIVVEIDDGWIYITVEFDNGEVWNVGLDEEFLVIPKKEKVIFT